MRRSSGVKMSHHWKRNKLGQPSPRHSFGKTWPYTQTKSRNKPIHVNKGLPRSHQQGGGDNVKLVVSVLEVSFMNQHEPTMFNTWILINQPLNAQVEANPISVLPKTRKLISKSKRQSKRLWLGTYTFDPLDSNQQFTSVNWRGGWVQEGAWTLPISWSPSDFSSNSSWPDIDSFPMHCCFPARSTLVRYSRLRRALACLSARSWLDRFLWRGVDVITTFWGERNFERARAARRQIIVRINATPRIMDATGRWYML